MSERPKEKENFLGLEHFKGDWDLFVKVVNSESVTWFWDIDGILADSPTSVFNSFNGTTGENFHPKNINDWDYLLNEAREKKLDEIHINKAFDLWYDAETLGAAGVYLHVKEAFELVAEKHGVANNFVLTSREPHLKDSTMDWFSKNFPEIPEKNILIRNSNSLKPTEFKASEIKRISKKSGWNVFIDDSTKYANHVLDSIPNSLVINIPLGEIKNPNNHGRLIHLERFPRDEQAMRPLLFALEEAMKV